MAVAKAAAAVNRKTQIDFVIGTVPPKKKNVLDSLNN
jgi:hypothetical protein